MSLGLPHLIDYPPLEPRTLNILGQDVEFSASLPQDLMRCSVVYSANIEHRGVTVPVSFVIANEGHVEFDKHPDVRRVYQGAIEGVVLRRAEEALSEKIGAYCPLT